MAEEDGIQMTGSVKGEKRLIDRILYGPEPLDGCE